MSRPLLAAALAVALCSCGGTATQSPSSPAQPAGPATPASAEGASPSAPATTPRSPITLSIVGTNDLHGALPRLPILAGYLNNLRAVRRASGGDVLLLDGGDMFQGTLESNIAEGADVVTAYNAMGYTAAAIGNHEFDFGPVGDAVTISKPEQDARGALKARAAEARFPFLVANIVDEQTQKLVDWPNVMPATKVTVAGVTVGIIGLSTQSTPYTTMPANFLGLKMAQPALAAMDYAKQLRHEGATVIIVVAHIGSACKDLTNPDDVSSCDRKDEVFDVIRAFPPGLVDAWVGGHTHAAVAHRINGVATIESYSSGRAFGRIDLTIDPQGKVTASQIFQPTNLCPLGADGGPVPTEQCAPGPYEGSPVVRDPEIAKIVEAASEKTRARREEKLGPSATAPITRSYDKESALGNWFTDMMLSARPDAQVALTNGGGLRANIPAGDITYGQLFEAMPFDNRFALIKLQGAQLREMLATNLSRGGAQYSWGGVTVVASCRAEQLALDVKVRGKALDDKKTYLIVTSDFLASGGDGTLAKFKLPPETTETTNTIMRDAFADVLRAKKGAAKKIDPLKLYDPKAPRQRYPTPRPVRCSANVSIEPVPGAGN
jgi:2',3'-cyclic-nucleotide 2'-phosphodiesterase (5'-nucleotidase family)